MAILKPWSTRNHAVRVTADRYMLFLRPDGSVPQQDKRHCGLQADCFLWYGSACCVSPVYNNSDWPSTDVGAGFGVSVNRKMMPGNPVWD